MRSLISIIRLIYAAIILKDSRSRFKLAERIFNKIYPRYFIGEWGKICHLDEEFIKWYNRLEGKNPHSFERKYTLKELIKLTLQVEGDTAELGVYFGASSYLIAKEGIKHNKKHHMFDSWEGLSKPTDEDGIYWSERDLTSSLKACIRNLEPLNKEFLIYYPGWIPDTFKDISNQTFFSFIHLDLDLYKPTKDGIEFFYKKIECWRNNGFR